ncbi:hypothetical protein B0T13DRAFT_456071 [Neurospora crassa]|nr:hypothetical protein B0T13DRAFT_456071 [Neurospora crassa]
MCGCRAAVMALFALPPTAPKLSVSKQQFLATLNIIQCFLGSVEEWQVVWKTKVRTRLYQIRPSECPDLFFAPPEWI